ncbi:MAG: c-type cytochrome, methanol metabolism-related [Alphaproteobacteria bacterium]|nr:c-type cytochrome, methanol metabolism-related [Alphaproteobacteria bacterium]
MSRAVACVAIALSLSAGIAYAIEDGAGDPTAVKSEDGKWQDKNGNPTFKIGDDGKVDWYTYVGFIRYSANCLQCHGPDGLGSTYAPSLVDSLKHIDYTTFYATVAGGKQNVSAAQNLVMPAEGANKNVMCYIDAIYVYLRARADGAVGRGRPAKHDDKPEAYTKAENECMG